MFFGFLLLGLADFGAGFAFGVFFVERLRFKIAFGVLGEDFDFLFGVGEGLLASLGEFDAFFNSLEGVVEREFAFFLSSDDLFQLFQIFFELLLSHSWVPLRCGLR